jgi:hypothetical protein
MGFLDKAKDLLSKNADKVDTAIDKAGDLVDKKTQGKYSSTVNKVQDKAKTSLKDLDKNTTGTGTAGDPQTPPAPPAPPTPPTPPTPPAAPQTPQ